MTRAVALPIHSRKNDTTGMAEQTSTAAKKREEVERKLQSKTGEIEAGLAALQEEVSTLGPAVRNAILEHPLVSVGGALVAGLVVGLLVGGKKKATAGLDLSASHRALLDRYVDALVEEARYRMAHGQGAEEALRNALADRVPLIVYEASQNDEQRGLVRQLGRLLLRSVVGIGIRTGLDHLMRASDLTMPIDEAGDAGG